MPAELRQILALALPVVVAELGWMFMGVVDTIMVGALGPTAIAGVTIGNTAFDPIAFTGIGLLLGLDTVVSQAFGAGRRQECERWLWHAVYLGACLALPLVLVVLALPWAMRAAAVNDDVLALGVPYLHALCWSLPPLLVYAAFRRYLQGIGSVRPVMLAVVSANIVNAVGNWLFIDRFGVTGVGWSTVAARVYLVAALAFAAARRTPGLFRRMPPLEMDRIRRLLSLGVPAGAQLLLEIGVFATAAILIGSLTPDDLAAHSIALHIAATTFMVPLGISAAAAVVVGHAIGRGDSDAARRAGWHALALGGGFMLAAAVVLWTIPDALIRIFTTDPGVRAIGIPLMTVAAVWQTVDGLQVVATGALRGAGNTRAPMIANLVAHWLVGLPVGWWLCFRAGLGVTGMWIGLSLGLGGVALLLLVVWSRTSFAAGATAARGGG